MQYSCLHLYLIFSILSNLISVTLFMISSLAHLYCIIYKYLNSTQQRNAIMMVLFIWEFIELV